jgi:hypothetical protein
MMQDCKRRAGISCRKTRDFKKPSYGTPGGSAARLSMGT